MDSMIVEVRDGVPMTSTLEVAERFEKRHSDVLRAVQTLECSREFHQRNFASTEYLDSGGRKQPMYWMTRDGWSMLVMGFTGKKASEWKEKFLKVFATLEKTLVAVDQKAPAIPSDYKGLMQVVGAFAGQQEKRLEEEQQKNRVMLEERARLINRVRSAERHRDQAKAHLDAVARHSYKALKEVTALFDAEQDDLMTKDEAAPNVLQLVAKKEGE